MCRNCSYHTYPFWNIQHKMFSHFLGKTDGYKYVAYDGTQWYCDSCRNLLADSILIVMKYYSRIWYDFVSFRIDLFETKLKSLIFYKLNCSIKDIEYFHLYLKYYWIHLSIQITQDSYVSISSKLDLYQEIVNYFANIMNNNNNKSSDIKQMNNINPDMDSFRCSNSERTPLSLSPLKDADMPIGIDSIINQTIENTSNIETSDNNDNQSSNNIDGLSKQPNKPGTKSPAYSARLRAHDDLDIKLKNTLIDKHNDADISATDLEIDISEIDSSDIGANVESLTSPTEGNKLTQANVSILQSLLSPKNESKSISCDPHKGLSNKHKTFQVVNNETKPKKIQFRSVTSHSTNKLIRFATDISKRNKTKQKKDLKAVAQTPDGIFASASQYCSLLIDINQLVQIVNQLDIV